MDFAVCVVIGIQAAVKRMMTGFVKYLHLTHMNIIIGYRYRVTPACFGSINLVLLQRIVLSAFDAINFLFSKGKFNVKILLY